MYFFIQNYTQKIEKNPMLFSGSTCAAELFSTMKSTITEKKPVLKFNLDRQMAEQL